MDKVNSKRYILIPNEIIKKISKLGGSDTFALYVNILLSKNWKEEVVTTSSILLNIMERDKQYLPNLRQQLRILVEQKAISIDNDISQIGLNKIIKISVLKILGNQIEIQCVNSKIFELNSTVNKNVLFSVYAYLKMATDRELNYALVSHKTISNIIGTSIKTVHKAVTSLDESGFITVIQGKYNSELRKNNANKYRVHNYGDMVYNSKLGIATIPDKENVNGESETVIDNKIAEVMANPYKFSPCVITGLAAKSFLKIYSLDESNLILTVSNLQVMVRILNQYGGILDLPQELFVLDFKTINERIERCLCAFIDESVFPLIFLTETGFNGQKLKGKLKHIIN